MAIPKNLRYFSESEKSKAEKELIEWMSGQFNLPEGESYEAIANDAIKEASKTKVIDLFNSRAMVESLVFKAQSVISQWT